LGIDGEMWLSVEVSWRKKGRGTERKVVRRVEECERGRNTSSLTLV
jgi:hypothetical protein